MLTKKLACPSCGVHLRIADTLPVGKKIKCPKCTAAFPVPGENGSPPMLHVFTVPMRGGAFAHEPYPESVRNLYTPWRVLVNPWYQDGCEGAPWLPGDPYQVIPSCAGWKDGHPADA